ncbi:MAG: hypothetical protein HKN18_00765 [Silicimonas sp.]|nr:hypothetical protein [Silicimonas sp.]
MIERDDLRAAVAAGTITEAQAARLIALSEERQGVRAVMRPSDEPFELFRGLNEIFIVVGLTILTVGWFSVGVVLFEGPGSLATGFVIQAVVGLVIIAALARYFTLKRRMVAPSIALAVLTGLSLLQLGFSLSEMLKFSFQHRFLLTSALCAGGLLVFWGVFRVPFTLALIGAATLAFCFAFSLANGAALMDLPNAFFLSAEGPFALITVVLGLVALAFALAFDLSDPHRVTRRSANGFWLHVVAAPAIVNTVAMTLLVDESLIANTLLLVFLLVIALFAIVIDRRSFLMAGAGYAVALSVIVLEEGSAVVILLLGLGLVILGAKWEAIRGRVLTGLPSFPGKDRLPPWTATVSEG